MGYSGILENPNKLRGGFIIKNKTLLLLIIGILIYVVFATIVITSFNYVSNNTIDKIAITYIRNSSDIQQNYGEIIHIGKNILYETKNDKSIIKSPYTVETETGRVIVYITLVKCNEDWEVTSLEVVEVITNE